MNIRIRITKEVLQESMYCPTPDESTQFNNIQENCVFAVALREFFPDARVTSDLIYPFHNDNITFIEMNWAMKEFISVFDEITPEERIELTPEQFELEIPSGILERVGISEVYKVLSESSSLQLVSI